MTVSFGCSSPVKFGISQPSSEKETAKIKKALAEKGVAIADNTEFRTDNINGSRFAPEEREAYENWAMQIIDRAMSSGQPESYAELIKYASPKQLQNDLPKLLAADGYAQDPETGIYTSEKDVFGIKGKDQLVQISPTQLVETGTIQAGSLDSLFERSLGNLFTEEAQLQQNAPTGPAGLLARLTPHVQRLGAQGTAAAQLLAAQYADRRDRLAEQFGPKADQLLDRYDEALDRLADRTDATLDRVDDVVGPKLDRAADRTDAALDRLDAGLDNFLNNNPVGQKIGRFLDRLLGEE